MRRLSRGVHRTAAVGNWFPESRRIWFPQAHGEDAIWAPERRHARVCSRVSHRLFVDEARIRECCKGLATTAVIRLLARPRQRRVARNDVPETQQAMAALERHRPRP
jgi:hypothetical protein